ncbi:MAG: glycosyltransferase family 4 protein, partial [Candidatus Methanomethylicaceae archaeon]
PACEVVYCFSSVAREVFQMLEGTATLRVLDQGIPPLSYEDRLVRDQETVYSEWCRERPRFNGVEEYSERQRQEWALTDVILCPSQFCRRALLEEGAPENKIRLLPFGIVPRFLQPFAAQAKRNGLRVLFAGNSPVRKGLPDLVLALEQLRTRHVHGVFVGETSSLTSYALTRTRRVADVLGNVPRPQMVDLYRSADVFVLPTVSDVFPAVILEAMAAGLPVITTPNCGSGEIIRDGVEGFIVPVRAPDVIAEKLTRLLENPEKRIEMGQAAHERAKEFTIEQYREKLLVLLRQEVMRRF